MARNPTTVKVDSAAENDSARPNLLAAADVTALLASLSGPREHEQPEETAPFFPDLMISEATTAFLVLGLLSVLCIFLPADLDAVSDAMKALGGAKPDWYFLFMHGLLRLVPASIGISALILGVVLLAALPWLDRSTERRPGRRPAAMALAAALLAAVAMLTYVGLTR